MFATTVGAEIADRLYSQYLEKEWLLHASVRRVQLTKHIGNETTRVITQIIQPIIQINARIAVSLFIGIVIFASNPKIAIIGFFYLCCCLLFSL